MPQSGGPATDMATVFFPLGVLERLGMVIDMSYVIDMSWNVVVYLNVRGETENGNSSIKSTIGINEAKKTQMATKPIGCFGSR